MSYGFPDKDAQRPYEEGYPLPEAPPAGQLPPGDGANLLPHYLTFAQIVNYASRVYRWTHDEALRDSRTNALAIRRDPVIMDALRSRQLPTAQLAWHLECEDDQDTRQAEAVDELTAVLEHTPRFQQLKMHLLEALWYGRYGVQCNYQWSFRKGKKFLTLRDFHPINGDKLVFRFSGQPGVLVHQQYGGIWEQTDRGRAHFFDQHERDQLILHRHEPEDADFYEPELGGGIQGVGIRSRIYWLWYLRSQVTAFLMDYLERIGAGGLTLYYYEAGSQTSANEVTNAIANQHRNNALLFPRYRDGTKGGPGVERVEPSTAGAQLMQGLVTQYFDSVMRRYILGQNLTTEAGATGLGSGLADLHGETFARYIKYDAVNLQDTLTHQLLHVLQKNSPYCALPPLRFVFDVDKPNANETLGAAQAFYQMGGSVDEDQLRSIIGLEKPAPGASILAQMGSMSPAAAGGVPEGVPMMGAPGPDMGQGGPPPVAMRKRGQPVRFARKPKLAAWNPFPYLRAVREHFAGDNREQSRIITSLADRALAGDRHALLVLGDALQESHEPEWFHTILEHGLAWPPWEGKNRAGMLKAPKLSRLGAHPDSGNIRKSEDAEDMYRIHRFTPVRERIGTGAGPLHWGNGETVSPPMTLEEVRRYPGIHLPLVVEQPKNRGRAYWDARPRVNLTAPEFALLQKPTEADNLSLARLSEPAEGFDYRPNELLPEDHYSLSRKGRQVKLSGKKTPPTP